MKTANAKGLGFGFAAVNAGQRNVSVEPQVVVISTEGSFRITSAVSRALSLTHGEYLMFLNNVDNIEAAIVTQHESIVEFCEANGLELGSPEASVAIHREFDAWIIAKGILEYDLKGNTKTVTERLSKNDKIKFVTAKFDEMLAAALEEAPAETQAALTRDGITKEEQIDILSAFITPKELPKYKGSKVANSSGLVGAGLPLSFTDTNVWKQLKADMGDDATKFNRVFDVDLDNVQDIEINNGYETVPVKGLLLGNYVDKEPSRVGAKNEEEEEA